jgi:hypothetical protein
MSALLGLRRALGIDRIPTTPAPDQTALDEQLAMTRLTTEAVAALTRELVCERYQR